MLIACFILICIFFGRAQDIWVDESTQLSGVRLPIESLFAWLGGAAQNRFGLPGDRMPPLGYLTDHCWWLVAGDGELRFRMFHMLFAAAGVAFVAREEIKAFGTNWLGVALLFFVLSPKMIEVAVELRSYSLFFAGTCVLVALFLDLVKSEVRPLSWGKLLRFSVVCLALSYIHFFGVVTAFSFFATLLVVFRRCRNSLNHVFVAGTILAVGLLGLYPFIFGATEMSVPGTSASPSDLIHYALLLLGHSSLMLYPPAAVLFFAGASLLIIAAYYGAAVRAAQRRTQPLDWLLLVAVIGLAVTVIPGFVINNFPVLKPSYSIWLLPIFALIIALGASQSIGLRGWDRYGRPFSLAILLTGAAIGTAIFLLHAAWFVHGPHRVIETARARSLQPSAIVYAEPETYGVGYFPMVYQGGGRFPQWLAWPQGVSRLPAIDGPLFPPLAALASYREIVIVDTHMRRYPDLRDCLNDRCPDFPVTPLVEELVSSGHWSVAAQTRAFGLFDTMVTRLRAK